MSGRRAFYKTFGVSPEETIGRFIYDLGDGQWNIPVLRTLLEEVLPNEKALQDFEVVQLFPSLGGPGNAAECQEALARRKQPLAPPLGD
jgi:two-component system CheB/CheR fusion protein